MGPQLCSCGNLASRPRPASRPRCFNGAATLQLRKLGRDLAVQTLNLARFNGAATLQLRKQAPCRLYCMAERAASMGPQLCSCGNTVTVSLAGDAPYSLQWGRNFAVAETMRSFGLTSTSGLLQWGRNFAVAETRAYFTPSGTWKCWLQWGRNFAVAETLEQMCVIEPDRFASIDPMQNKTAICHPGTCRQNRVAGTCIFKKYRFATCCCA